MIGQVFLMSAKLSRPVRLVGWIVAMINVVFNIVSAIELFRHIGIQFKDSNVFHGLFSSTTIIPILFAAFANIYSPNRIQQICDAFGCILRDVETKFNVLGAQRLFYNTYNRKMAWIMLSFLILLLPYGVAFPSNTATTMHIVYIVLNFQKDCLVLQCVFYADFIKLILRVLGVHMAKVAKSRQLDCQQKRKMLLKLKWMHLNLWEVMKCVNEHHGWTLIAIIFDAFIYILRMIFLQFLYLNSLDTSTNNLTRKYAILSLFSQFLCYLCIHVLCGWIHAQR